MLVAVVTSEIYKPEIISKLFQNNVISYVTTALEDLL